MGRQIEVYGHWTDHPADEAEWTCGSGLLLGGRLVLTAAHVVCPAGQPLVTVRIRDESGLVTAAVEWHCWGDELDVALLVVTEGGWRPPVWRHPVRWGRLVTSRAEQPCEAIGFPAVVAEPARRDSHHAVGVINPGSLVKSGLYAMEVRNPPAAPGPAGSWWAGMSGAALLDQGQGLVVGVVTVDPRGFDSRRLVTVPIAAVAGDPEFRELVARHCGRAPVLEPVELIGLAEPVRAPDSPAGLLRADAAHTPFRPRPELDQLLRWCESDVWSSIRLVAGPGGQGKTRLAHHLAGQLDPDGWATLLLGEHAGASDLTVLADVATPTLVVVDYAEGRTGQLDPLIAALDLAEAKVRLLLLARTAGAWRTERLIPAAHLSVLADDRIVIQLSPVETDPGGRELAWREAVDALATRLVDLDAYRHVPWAEVARGLDTPRLEGGRYRTILAALLHAGDPAPAQPRAARTAQDVLLDHEARYWSRVADQFQIRLAPPTRRCLVALATLWGATSRDDAHRALRAWLGPADPDLVVNAADWLAALYRDSQRYWSGLQPDLLGEYLIGAILRPGGDCPDLTHSTDQASPAQLEQALTVLGRADPQHPHMAQTITATVLAAGVAGARAAVAVIPRLEQPQPVLDALDRFIETADLDALNALYSLHRFILLLGPTVKIAAAVVELLRAASHTNRDAYLPDLATAVNNLAIRLADSGRRAEALTAAQEAVDLYRELAVRNRDGYLSDVAKSVKNLAWQLGESGRRAEALAAAQEAVDLYRELAADYRYVLPPADGHLPDLATAVNDLAIRLADSGRRAEGLAAAQEAVDLYRELAWHEPDQFRPDVERTEALRASLSDKALRPRARHRRRGRRRPSR
jgi:tetratricopeptide (TPR) repeat protein